MRRHFRWSNEKTPMEYIDNSKAQGRKMAALITGQQEEPKSTEEIPSAKRVKPEPNSTSGSCEYVINLQGSGTYNLTFH